MPSSEVALELAQFGLKPQRSLIIITVLLAVTTIAVLLRFYVRIVMLKKFDLSDWLLLGALITYMAESGLYIAFCQLMLDYGIVKEILLFVRVFGANESCYIVSQILLKASLAVYFLRIIVVYTWQKRVIQVSIAVYEVFSIAAFFLFVFQSGVPTEHNLVLGPNAKHDIGPTAIAVLAYVRTGLNIAVDWIFTLLPLSVVVQANIPLRAKLTVCFLILLGAAGSIATCVRIKYLSAILAQDRAKIFFVIQPFTLVTFAESSAGLIAISLATLRPLFRALVGRSSIASKSTSTAANMHPTARMSRTAASGRGSKRTTGRSDLDIDLGGDLDDEMWTGSDKGLKSCDGKEVMTTIEPIFV